MAKKVGTPVWIACTTNNMSASKKFYTELFDWQFNDLGPDFGGYNMLKCGDALVGGMMDVSDQQCPDGTPVPSLWGVWLAVDDVEARCTRAKAAGGQVLDEGEQIGDFGRQAMIMDPTGATVAMWEPQDLETLDIVGKPGTPVWFELVTNDYAAATTFYRDVFDFDIHTMDMGEDMAYATNGIGDSLTSGICGAPWLSENDSPYWRVYFGVDGADAAAEKVTALGGEVTDGPEDSPNGRMLTIRDPDGATLMLCSMSEATAN